MKLEDRPDVDLDTAKYLLFGLESVEGWGIDAYLARLFLSLNDFHRNQKIYGNLFEIGVHHGRTAVLLALMSTQGEFSIFVDLFDRQDENIDFSGLGNREIFELNLERWAPGRREIVILRENSIDLDFTSVPELREGVRFAHVDGAHHKAAVLNDIRKTASVLIERGVLVVDDFMHSGFPSVNEACNLYLEEDPTLAPVAIGRNKLILTTKGSETGLRQHLAAGCCADCRTVSFHGYDVLCLDPH
jgi:hypothetical protein